VLEARARLTLGFVPRLHFPIEAFVPLAAQVLKNLLRTEGGPCPLSDYAAALQVA
jgi:hypothetical protein